MTSMRRHAAPTCWTCSRRCTARGSSISPPARHPRPRLAEVSAVAGVWRLDGAPGADRACARMLAALAPYGPHACDQRACGDVALGRRLFRVLPEDRHDAGPVAL